MFDHYRLSPYDYYLVGRHQSPHLLLLIRFRTATSLRSLEEALDLRKLSGCGSCEYCTLRIDLSEWDHDVFKDPENTRITGNVASL